MNSETSNNQARVWSRGNSLYFKTRIFDESVHAAMKEMHRSGHSRWIPELKAWQVSNPQKGSCYSRLRVVLKQINWKMSPDAAKIIGDSEEKHRALIIKDAKVPYSGRIPSLLEPTQNQRVAINWFLHGQKRNILRDSPGSGKSLVPLSLLAMGKYSKLVIVCSSNLLPTWRWLSEKSLESASVSLYTSGKWSGSAESNVLVCSYDSSERALEKIKRENALLVVDESHRCGKASSKRYKKLKKIALDFSDIILLSGNDPQDDPESFFNEICLLWPQTTKTKLAKYYSLGSGSRDLQKEHIDWDRLFGDLGAYYLRRCDDAGMPKLTMSKEIITPPAEGVLMYKKEVQEILLKRGGLDAQAATHLLEFCGRMKEHHALKLAYELVRDRKVLIIYRFERSSSKWNDIPEVGADNACEFSGRIARGKASELQEGVDLSNFDAMIVVDPFAGPSQRRQVSARLRRLSRKEPAQVIEICLDGLIDCEMLKLPQMPPRAQLKALQNKLVD